MKLNNLKPGEKSGIYAISYEIWRNRTIYLLALPVLAYYIIFAYIPMYGVTIAFKDYSPRLGILGSQWIGFRHFTSFFTSFYFFRIVRNTFLISFYDLLFGFPMPILLALMINEVKNRLFKRTMQTISYLPYFVSIVVISGIIKEFTQTDGLVNDVIEYFGGTRVNFLSLPDMFRSIFVSTNIWQNVGWGSIIYLAALSNIDPQLYDAADIDGANRFAKMRYVTIPGMINVIVILLILRCGSLLSVGFEKVILLYNPLIYETSDVISSFVYRRGIEEASFSYSTAVGLFNSVINMLFLVIVNTISRRVSENSLW
ncbi:MAG: ABC transporter permease subunit [Bacillota bacterium]|nr:ABC transporter permease subunit [Bacillota bacterium]